MRKSLQNLRNELSGNICCSYIFLVDFLLIPLLITLFAGIVNVDVLQKIKSEFTNRKRKSVKVIMQKGHEKNKKMRKRQKVIL